MKKLPKYVWANGVGMSINNMDKKGITRSLWFPRAKKFVLHHIKGSFGSEIDEYVPVGDKKSNFYDGGFFCRH